MSKETAKKLIAELATNKDLYDKVKGIENPAELVKIALNEGYDVTTEDLIDAEKAYRRDKAAETDEKLSFDDLEDVAGGRMGEGEEAPDGHEMGCILTYHWDGYSKETGNYCQNNFYCTSDAYECVNFSSTCVGTTSKK